MMEKNLGGEQTIAENKDVVKEKLLKERAVVEENNDEAKVGNTKESEEDDESFAWCNDQLRLDVVNLFLNQHISSNLLNTLQNIFLSNEKSTIDKQNIDKPNYFSQNRFQMPRYSQRPRFLGNCWVCNKTGHKSDRCYNNPNRYNQNNFNTNNLNVENEESDNNGGRDPNYVYDQQ